MCERSSDHHRPTGGSLVSQSSPAWLGRTARPVPAHPELPLGRAGLPAPPIRHAAPGTARERRERGGHAAALRAAGGGQRFARVPTVLTDAGAAAPAVGKHAQRPGAAATARPAAVVAASAALGSRFAAASRRPGRLRGAVSELSHVRRDIGARLVKRPDGHGCVGEG